MKGKDRVKIDAMYIHVLSLVLRHRAWSSIFGSGARAESVSTVEIEGTPHRRLWPSVRVVSSP
jgi:hypothetical protein